MAGRVRNLAGTHMAGRVRSLAGAHMAGRVRSLAGAHMTGRVRSLGNAGDAVHTQLVPTYPLSQSLSYAVS